MQNKNKMNIEKGDRRIQLQKSKFVLKSVLHGGYVRSCFEESLSYHYNNTSKFICNIMKYL